ncbi:family 1 glycosylhydrolase [Nocardia sp. NBC_01329]|uniref:family 1 glycosylhydrolase n=1 Tax=Nocardia sp. NBC_01329 TaxID=2903594 RepID=UPI002E15692D|nr:family 1 glycosylhydrolase [Nocardia sp. NBC_01329]
MSPVNRRRFLTTSAVAAGAVALGAGRAAARPAPPVEIAPLGPDFLWGVASSGFQSEGRAPDSNWTRYIAAGKTEDPYRDSVDFYSRYRSDIALAERLGVRSYRIGIEWARVQPRPDDWDEEGFGFYDRVIETIRAAGMRPMLTLDHWVYPGWQADLGGWRRAGMVDDWLANARKVVDRYARHDPLWITFNEPAAYLMNEVRHGGIGVTDIPAMQDRMAAAHNAVYDHIHRVRPGAMVSSNVAYIPAAEDAVNGAFLARVGAKLDFIGIDYYYGFSPAGVLAQLPDPSKLWTLSLQAEGIYYALDHYAKRFPGTPLYIVENGMPTENGKPRADGYTRADLLRDTVYWLQRAAADGMNVMGYNYWSLTDNYEWGSYTPRFGLYTVDVLSDPALTRRPTDAVAAYTAITGGGGVPSDYRPTRGPAACSIVDGLTSCIDQVIVPR